MAGESPRIEHLAWGRMRVAGLGSGGDWKLFPGGGRPWDWRETGTRHSPGVQPRDLAELLEHGARVVVLGLGMHGRLQVTGDARELLRERGVEVIAADTPTAVTRYNERASGQAVGGLFHTTC